MFSKAFCQFFTVEQLMAIQQFFYIQSSEESEAVDYAFATFEDSEGIQQAIEIAMSFSHQESVEIFLIDIGGGRSRTIDRDRMMHIISTNKVKHLHGIEVD